MTEIPNQEISPEYLSIALFVLVNKHSEVLLAKVKPEHIRRYGSQYVFPGGKIESAGQEGPLDAALRELQEETKVKVDRDTVKYVGMREASKIRRYYFLCKITDDVQAELGDTENFEALEWVPKANLNLVMNDVYPRVITALDNLES